MVINLRVLHFDIAKDMKFNWLFIELWCWEINACVSSSILFHLSDEKGLQKCSELQRRSHKDFVFGNTSLGENCKEFTLKYTAGITFFALFSVNEKLSQFTQLLRRSRKFRIPCLERTIERAIFRIILKSSTLHCGCNYGDEWDFSMWGDGMYETRRKAVELPNTFRRF